MEHYVKKFNFQAFRTWIGSSLYVVITDPKDVEVIAEIEGAVINQITT